MKNFRTYFIQALILFFPFFIIFYFGRELILSISNPSMGDLVAMPEIRLPLSNLLYPWIDNFVGSFGGHYVPHVLGSQFLPILPSSVLQFILLYFIFVVLLISFLDFFHDNDQKKSYFDRKNCLSASALVLIIYFSVTFTVNLVQGNPDVYYAYLFCIPGVLYLYRLFKTPTFENVIRLTLVITFSTYLTQFSLYYLAIFMFPYFIFFMWYFRKSFKNTYRYLLLLLGLLLLTNLPIIYTTLKPALSAVSHVVSKDASITSVLSEMYMLYQGINFLNAFYFAGNAGDYSWLLFNIPGGSMFREYIIYSFAPVQIILALCLVFFLSKKDSYNRVPQLLLGISMLFLLSIFLVVVWDASWFTEITSKIPITPLFRNPKKLLLSVYVAFILVLLFSSIFTRKKYYLYILGAILACNAIVLLPLLSDGYNGLKNTSDKALKISGTPESEFDSQFFNTYSFPNRYLGLREYLVSYDKLDPKSDYRIVVMPDNHQALYQSHLRYLFLPFSVSTSQAIFGGLIKPEDYMVSMYESFLNSASSSAKYLELGNIKYMIVDRKSPYQLFTDTPDPKVRQYYGTYTTGNPELFKSLLDQKKELVQIYSSPDFYIYQNRAFKNTIISTPHHICDQAELLKLSRECEGYLMKDMMFTPTTQAEVNKVIRKNLTTYDITAVATKSGSTMVVFNQVFDVDWQLTTKNDEVTIANHTIGNGFSNAWMVSFPKAGTYELEVSFRTQPVYSAFAIISYSSVLILGMMLLINTIRRKDRI